MAYLTAFHIDTVTFSLGNIFVGDSSWDQAWGSALLARIYLHVQSIFIPFGLYFFHNRGENISVIYSVATYSYFNILRPHLLWNHSSSKCIKNFYLNILTSLFCDGISNKN